MIIILRMHPTAIKLSVLANRPHLEMGQTSTGRLHKVKNYKRVLQYILISLKFHMNTVEDAFNSIFGLRGMIPFQASQRIQRW